MYANVIIYLFDTNAPSRMEKADELIPKFEIINKCREVKAHCLIPPATHKH